jgi:hypothetical protein
MAREGRIYSFTLRRCTAARKSNSAARYFAGVKDHCRRLAQRHLLDASCKGGAASFGRDFLGRITPRIAVT